LGCTGSLFQIQGTREYPEFESALMKVENMAARLQVGFMVLRWGTKVLVSDAEGGTEMLVSKAEVGTRCTKELVSKAGRVLMCLSARLKVGFRVLCVFVSKAEGGIQGTVCLSARLQVRLRPVPVNFSTHHLSTSQLNSVY
jgi:hypothetical protein